MRPRLVQAGLGAALAAGVFFGGRVLIDETMTRHDQVSSGSMLEVTLTVATRSGAEESSRNCVGLVSMCQLEVRADVMPDSLVLVGESRYRFRLRPTLDEADRRQLTGCLQDLRVDHALANVVSLRDVGADDLDDDGAG